MKQNRKMKILFICIVLLLSGSSIIIYAMMKNTEAQQVKICVDGQEIGTYSLKVNQSIPISTKAKAIIENGAVKMEWSDCPDHLCMKQGWINLPGESIICLPNRITIQIEGDIRNNKTDVIVQ